MVAKNKAKNYIARDHVFSWIKLLGISQYLLPESVEIEIDLSDKNIIDSQLQGCYLPFPHPSISTEAQIGLALRFLCGFGIDEIANALLSNKETINKRLFRAKEKLRMVAVKN